MTFYPAASSTLNRLCRRLVVTAFVSGIAIAPAPALESDWAETEGGRMRLVVDPEPRADGSIMAVLDVDLEPGWKTYWREPGSAGIPPTVDFSTSKGIVMDGFHYPAPVHVDDGYAVWAGYTAPVRFPIELRRTGSGAAEIRAQTFIGICEKVCIPFQAELAVDLPAATTGSGLAKAIVNEALANLPETEAADFRFTSAKIDAEQMQLDISAALPAFRPSGTRPDLFISGPPGSAFAPPALLTDADGIARWRVAIKRLPAGADSLDAGALNAVATFGRRSITANLDDVGVSPN